MNEATTKDGWLNDYRIQPGFVRLQAVLAILSLLAAAAASAGVLLSWYYALTRHGPAAIWNWTRLPLFLTAILIPLFLIFLLRWNSLSRILVRTHTRGIQIYRGRKRTNIPWTSITEVYTSPTRYGVGNLIWKKENRIRLAGEMRKPITIPEKLENIEALVNTIRTSVYTRMGAEMDHRIASGETARFGPIQISRQALTLSGMATSWKDLETLDLQDGYLSLVISGTHRPKTIRLRASRIPNLDLCYQLIRKISGV